jgi:hypothetical protein
LTESNASLRETSSSPGTERTPGLEKWPSWELSPPPEGDPRVGPWVWEKIQVMKKYRDSLDLPSLWSHFHELYRNRIFRNKSKFSQTPANLYFKIINSLKANLTDQKPKASIMPRGDTPDEISDGWQAKYDEWWEHSKQQKCLELSVGNSELYGYACDKMVFNPELEAGIGDIQTVRGDTFGTLFWPKHTDIQTMPMIGWLEVMDLGEIIRRWPKASDGTPTKDNVKGETEYSELMGEARAVVRGNRSSNLRPIGAPPGFYTVDAENQGAQYEGAIERSLVGELWVKDYTMVMADPRTGKEVQEGEELPLEQGMQPMIDDATGQHVVDQTTGQPAMVHAMVPVEPVEMSKYPGFIRCIRVTDKGKMVLEDLPNPSINPELPRETTCQTYLWDKFPILKRDSYSDGISEYGLSIMEQVEPLILEVSKKLTQYGVNIDTRCKAVVILPQNCGVKRRDVNNLPARVWEPIGALSGAIRYLDTPNGPSDVITYIELLIRLIDDITGIQDVSEGRRPTGITAASAIQALQEKAQVIYREKIRNNDLYLEEQGRMFISLGQNWLTEEQSLKYEGKGQPQDIPFRGTEFQGEMSFHIEAGSTLPHNRAYRQGVMTELAKAGKLTNKTLFRELAIPNGDEEAARLEAGPMGIAMQKLEQSGQFDPATLQAIQNVVSLDDKQFSRAFPQSKNPNLQAVENG